MRKILVLLPILLAATLVLSVEASDSPQPKLIIEGAENSELEFTLKGTDTMDVLPTGSVIARILEIAECEDEPCECEECEECEVCEVCEPCESCPDVCDATVSFTQFQVTANGTNYTNGQAFSITRGGNITVRWKAPGAATCTASGMPGTTSWSGNSYEPFSGGTVSIATGQMPDLDDPANYTLRLVCTNGPNLSVSRQVTVTVNPPESDPGDPVPESCVGVPTLEQASGGVLTRTSECVETGRDCRSFTDVFGDPFPGGGNQQQFSLRTNRYVAMRFTVPQNLPSNAIGGMATEVWFSALGGARLMSFTSCPGDFETDRLAAPACMRRIDGPDTQLRWARAGNENAGQCPLTPGETYYLNIVFTNAAPGTPMEDITWGCTDPVRCGHLLTSSHNVN